MPSKFRGVMQSPVTPLKDDFSLDLPTFERLLDFHVRTGATAISWPHHKGESLNLTVAELKKKMPKAYAELEHQGVIETSAGRGSFISANNSPLKKDVRRRLLAQTIDDAVVQAHHLQIDRADFLRLAEERFDVLEDKRSRAASS